MIEGKVEKLIDMVSKLGKTVGSQDTSLRQI